MPNSVDVSAQHRPQRSDSLNTWLEWIETIHAKDIDMGLERSQQVYRHLQAAGCLPDHPFVVTIGGTNGKGTTLKMLENTIRQSGFSVASYTSPHLFIFNERVRLNGENIQDIALIQAFELIDQHRQNMPLTYYEFTTLAAFIVMARQPCDVWLLEVGLGGRLDTVNIIDADLAVITSIALDHEAFLGSTREAIAAEKIEIARPGGQVFVGGTDMPETIAHFCQVNDVQCYDFSTRHIDITPSQEWSLQFHGFQIQGQSQIQGSQEVLQGLPWPQIPLQNAALALQVWTYLAPKLGVSPWERVDPHQVVAQTQVFGRFSKLQEKPEVIVDAAHNPAAAVLLASSVAILPVKPTVALCGMMSDKDVKGTISPLLSHIESWILVPLDMPRALDPELLRLILIELGVKPDTIQVCADVNTLQMQDHYRYLVFGSFMTLEAFIRQRHSTLQS